MPTLYEGIPKEEAPPRAKAMIKTFRAFGYNLQTAIADIIDNSITAHANNVWISYAWNGEKSWVTLTDDGDGMDEQKLVEAMTPGTMDPDVERDEHDLGRFGLGLKTSSFSQCKKLTVITKKKGQGIIYRYWDLDYIDKVEKWNLLEYLPDEIYKEELEKLTNGTTVVWENLDRLVGNANKNNEAARKAYLNEFENVEEHLSLTFHRYLEQKKLAIWLNGNKLTPWDPYLKESEGGQLLACESLNSEQIEVKCFVLPHISKLDVETKLKSKPESWYNLQGYYIYRNNRLIMYGDWLGLFSKYEHCKNARILIDIPNKIDHEWKIDIKKATATPSVIVRKDLIRLGKLTRKAAAAVHRFRGNEIMLDDTISSFTFQSVWKTKKTRDESRHYYINTDHPVIKTVLEKDNISRTEFKRILKLLGDTTPVESIIQFHSEEPQSHELRDIKKEPDSGTIQLAKMMYESLRSTGISKDMATKQIFNIEPFNQFTQLIESFN